MQGVLKKLAAWLPKPQAGFTLVELLVVVGIVVALAAVVVPNVSKFAGKGEEGAKAAETESIQAAMDTMMADKNITAVTARATPDSSNSDFTSLPAGTGAAALKDYLRQNPTKYFYCWDGTGKVTRQDAAATTCP